MARVLTLTSGHAYTLPRLAWFLKYGSESLHLIQFFTWPIRIQEWLAFPISSHSIQRLHAIAMSSGLHSTASTRRSLDFLRLLGSAPFAGDYSRAKCPLDVELCGGKMGKGDERALNDNSSDHSTGVCGKTWFRILCPQCNRVVVT